MINHFLDSIIHDEGFRANMYLDSLGYESIGYGTLIDKRRGGGLTKPGAKYLAEIKVKDITRELNGRVPWWKNKPLNIQTAMVNMAYQLGVSGLLNFRRMMLYLQAGNWKKAAEEALDSKWAREDTPERAKRIAELIRRATD